MMYAVAFLALLVSSAAIRVQEGLIKTAFNLISSLSATPLFHPTPHTPTHTPLGLCSCLRACVAHVDSHAIGGA